MIWPRVRSQPIKDNYASFYSGLASLWCADMQERSIGSALKTLCFRRKSGSCNVGCCIFYKYIKKKKMLSLCWFIYFFCSVFFFVIHTRPDATFPNCPLWCPRATELNYYNGDEWEAMGEKGQEGGSYTATRKSTLHPPPLLLLPHTHIHTHTARKTEQDEATILT